MYEYILYIVLLSITTVNSEAYDDQFKLDVPNIHGSQEIYKAFQNTYKIENLPELEGNILTSTTSRKTNDSSNDCKQDLTSDCPEGWENNNKVCKAPNSYKGECKKIISFDSMTIDEKLNWSISCNVKWPCKLESKCNDRNYLQPCPELFIKQKSDNGDYICVPDYSLYDGPCDTFMDFTNFTDDAKRQWAESCKTDWPCMTKCINIFFDCPMDWTLDNDGFCRAPIYYKGPCDVKKSFKYFTPKMKLDYVKSCNIPFECIETCIKDYNKCPVNWTSDGNFCLPPNGIESCSNDYVNILDDVKNINKLSKDNKIILESKCILINWPCEVNDNIDWSLPCPEGRLLEHNGNCTGILDTDDECKISRSFDTEEDKRFWSSQCNIPWPSINNNEMVTIPGINDTKTINEEKNEVINRLNGPISSGMLEKYSSSTQIGTIHVIKEHIIMEHKPKDMNYQSQLKNIKRKYIDL